MLFLQVVEKSMELCCDCWSSLSFHEQKGLLRKKTEACLQRQDKRTKGWEDHGEVKKNGI